MARDGAGTNTGAGTTGKSSAVRRPKSSQACTACKKQKTRCEMISTDERLNGRCHRCTTLRLQCSLQITPIRSDKPVPLLRDPLQLIADWASKEYHEISSLGPALGDDGGPKRLSFIGRMWSFVTTDYHQIDWSSLTSSFHLVLDHMFPPTAPTPIPPSLQPTLSSIIDPSQITRLLDIFEQHYDPWLCFKSTRHQHTPLLDLVRCSIASRHLEPSVRKSVAPSIHHLAETQITSLIFDPPSAPTMQHIQALFIFGLWAPLKESPHRGIRDGRQILASAASLACSLRFHQVSTYIIEQRKKSQSVSDEMVLKAQVWLSLCNAESMMCLGTGRLPTTRRSDGDRKIFLSSEVGTLEEGRRCRLQALASLYDLAERGTCINLTDLGAIEQWYKNVEGVLEVMATLHETISPMIAVTDNEHFAFHSLKIHYMFCRLHAIYSNVFSLRYAVRHLPPGPLWSRQFLTRPNGLELVPQLARSAHKAAESVMELIIYLLDGSSGGGGGEPEFIGFCLPDSMYLHISVCAAILVGAKFLVKRNRGLLLQGMSDQLLAKVCEKFGKRTGLDDNISLPPDHPANKASKLIEAIMDLWNQYHASAPPMDVSDPHDMNGNTTNQLNEYQGPTLFGRVVGGGHFVSHSNTPPASSSSNYLPHDHHHTNPDPPLPVLDPSVFFEASSPSSSHLSSSNDLHHQNQHQNIAEHQMNPQNHLTSFVNNASSLLPMNEEDLTFWQYFLSQENLASIFDNTAVTTPATSATPPMDSNTTSTPPSNFTQQYHRFSPNADGRNSGGDSI